MILISLLIALGLERRVVKTERWHVSWFVSRYHALVIDIGYLKPSSPPWAVILVAIAPAFALAIVESQILGEFLTFIEQTLILFICVGCPALRQTYRCFLRAADNGDLQACSLYTEQLGHDESATEHDGSAYTEGRSFGQHLGWLNYQHYAAVILWFIALGAPGALLYTFVRSFAERENQHKILHQVLFGLDFIPVRITTFGLLLMGHFSRALPDWLRLLGSTTESTYCVLTKITAKAEMLTPEEQQQQRDNAATEPRVLVKLAKRNIIFLLTMTAILTLTGGIA